MKLMRAIWKGRPKNDPLVKLSLLILSIVANSAGIKQHYSKMGHIYQDKHRSLLDPCHAHKTAVVNRSIKETHPTKPQPKRNFIRSDIDVSAQSVDGNNDTCSSNIDGLDEESDIENDVLGVQGLVNSLRRIRSEEEFDATDDGTINRPTVDHTP
ncbi:hypothetical protein F5146DRAFT_1006990 [Armillaria mellea]|nr:hypothetical protein F5146DRAFT_1006990 [Armillaria mellea]